MKKINNQNGITLIALIITIIILLILAGVSIMFLGKNGIIAKAKWSAYVTEYETIKEQEELYKDSYLIEKMGGTDKGEALSEISTEKNEIEMYPVSSKFNIGDAQNSLKESIKQIESINDNDLENENSVNLYKVDLNKINVKAKKSYVINIVSGMLYSIEHEEYQGKLYHTPRIGINSKKIYEKIDKVGIYEMTVDAGQTVNWDSIQIYYDKYIENSLSIKVYTSDDEVNWTEETIEKGSQLNNEEKYNLSNLNRTQYLKIKVEVKGISGKNAEVDYILVNFYKYREIEVKPQIETTGVEKTGTIYTVPTETNGETQAEGTGNIVQKITIPKEEGDYMLDLGEDYGSPSSQIKITNADGTEENYTITNNSELKKKQIKPGATVEIKTTLKAGEGIGQVKLLEKEKQLSTKTIGTIKNSATENKWVTVEKHKYAYNNGGIGYWEKCSVDDIEVDKTGIIQNAEDTEKRIKISYQVSTDGITWSKEFTNIQEAENKKYLKVQLEYQTLNGTEYGDTSNNKIKVTLNDGSWKVTFKDEDGTELLTKRVYFENGNKQGTIIIPNIEKTKEEKEFLCWKIDLDEYIPGSNYTVTQDIIFTAYYSKLTDPEGAKPIESTIIEGDANKGIVVRDSNGNEWVWVEVKKNITVGKTTDVDIEKALQTYASEYREGKTGQGCNWTDEWYAMDGSNLVTESTANLTTEQKALKNGCGLTYDEYNTAKSKMLQSIKTNGGFWISRYEAGIEGTNTDETANEIPNVRYEHSNITNSSPKAVSQANRIPYNYVYCSEAQTLASAMSTDSSKTSSLLFGIQWDLTCKFLETKTNLITSDIKTNSANWGNYSNSLINLTKGKYNLSPNSSDSKWINVTKGSKSVKTLLTTGASEDVNKMNIYDFAGNEWEWTLEKTSNLSYPCAHRGGSSYDLSSDHPASIRDFTPITYSGDAVSFRSTLY